MAYCRWSDDCFKSNVYVYESAENAVVIHIRHHRSVHPDGKPHPVDRDEWRRAIKEGDFVKCQDMMERERRWVSELVHVPMDTDENDYPDKINVSYDEAIDYLLELRKAGYHVPQRAIDELMRDRDVYRSREDVGGD